jgi:hypothetical protein
MNPDYSLADWVSYRGTLNLLWLGCIGSCVVRQVQQKGVMGMRAQQRD